ncbi:MFS general substrate transporter, partial [Aureobasidium melanogenum]
MLSSPAWLQCDNDESSTASDKPKDNNDSTCDDEPRIPEAVHADLSKYGLAATPDGLVDWKEEGTLHPRNWHINRKLYDSFLVILFEFVATVFSNTGTSSATYAAEEFKISETVAIFCFTTLYLLGQAIGSLVLPPYTETFGRRPSYIIACALYSISNIVIAATDHIAGVVVGRLVSGFVSALPSTVAYGSLEDMWDARARIWVFNIYIICAVTSLGVGPPVATYLATSPLGWRWTFWIAAIVVAVVTLLALFLRESRASKLLKTSMKKVASRHQDKTMPEFRPLVDEEVPSFKTFISECLTRPARLFLTEPIVTSVSLICSIIDATIYLFTEAIDVIYSDGFGYDSRHSSLINLTFTIGPIFSLLPRIYDMHVSNCQRKKTVQAAPEDKLFGFFLAAPLLAIASWYFAWTIPPAVTTVSPFVSMSALIVIGFAASEFDYVLSGYLTDTYGSWAGSANAPQNVLRGLFSGVLPLVATVMFKNIGSNGAASILAGIATAYCLVAFCFWKFGKSIREHSKFAIHDDDEEEVTSSDSVTTSAETM